MKVELTLPEDFQAQIVQLIQQAVRDAPPLGTSADEGFMNLGRAAKFADVSRTTLDRWIKAELINQYQIGGSQRISKKELSDFIKAHRITKQK
jgi:excisionase family DNA binding protein